jgi:iron complex transport system ATP-binding protein
VTATAQAEVLRTHELAVGYRTRRARRVVLERVNVAVATGELVCLLGANGIGKSTLLRTLAGMQPALAGRVELNSRDTRSLTSMEVARDLGVVLTDRAAIDGLTSRRVIELGRYPHIGWFGRMSAVDRGIVDATIDAVGIAHLALREVGRLSDGERQRVMIARALAQQPVLLMLDEPTAFLDLPSRAELMSLLRDLTRRDRVSVVVSTHDLELALRVADVVWLVMPGGELANGAPEDVMLSGAIAEAFEGHRLRFHLADRAFRLLTGHRGDAMVRGCGVRATLAAAVLEREGYSVVVNGGPAAVEVEVNDTGWTAFDQRASVQGANFGSLAAFLRGRRTSS